LFQVKAAKGAAHDPNGIGVAVSTKTKGHEDTVFFVDKQRFKVEDREYTVREVLEMAGEDPSQATLVRRDGDDLIKLTELDARLEIKPGTHFVVFHNGPTPVS
jgi:hypothetical protein